MALITIESLTIPNWQYGGDVAFLELSPVDPFVAFGGHFVNYKQIIECAIEDDGDGGFNLVVPAVELYSTTDSTNPYVEYDAILKDFKGHSKAWQPLNFQLPVELGTSITWDYLIINNAAANLPRDNSYYNAPQVDTIVNRYLSGQAGIIDGGTPSAEQVRVKERRGTAAQWTTANSILAAGQIGLETDTGKFKFGDGTHHWNDIDYAAGTSTGGDDCCENFGIPELIEGGGDFTYDGEDVSPDNQAIPLASLADADAPISSLYFSTDASKPVWKDSGGTVHGLY